MTEQAYYRLDELQAMGITEGKLRYLLEQEQVTPAFFMHNERFIIGGYLSNKFIGFAVADYSGLVTIHKQLIPELLTKGKVSIKQVLLMQKERIRIIATAYPFQVKTPNTYIDSWQQTDLAKLDWQAYPALFMPSEVENFLYKLSGMLQQIGATKANILPENDSPTMEKLPLELVVLNSELRFTDICIRNIDVNGFTSPEILKSQNTKTEQDRELREIDKLVFRIIAAYPNHRPTQIWSVLRAECSKLHKVYDIDEILEEVTSSELTWTDTHGKPKILKHKSFFALYKKIKNTNH